MGLGGRGNTSKLIIFSNFQLTAYYFRSPKRIVLISKFLYNDYIKSTFSKYFALGDDERRVGDPAMADGGEARGRQY